MDLSGTMLKGNTVYSVNAINTVDSLEVLMLQDYKIMPENMPGTGMGGATEEPASFFPFGIVSLLVIGGAVLVITQNKLAEQ